MSNDKDFVVETGIEVSGTFNYTNGTITSGTVDLSSGCNFKETLSGNTTYTFSNANTTQVFRMEITGASSYTITWPASVKWHEAVSPSAPSAGEIKTYVFITGDGGTSYIGGVI